jgi:hypothetical protein
VKASIAAEAVMNKAVLIMIALATTALLGSRPAQAYYDGPWCGVYSIGDGSSVEKCDFRNFESCQAEMIAGNRGFCRQNGYYNGNPEVSTPRPRKHKYVQP